MKNTKSIIIFIIVLVVILGGIFLINSRKGSSTQDSVDFSAIESFDSFTTDTEGNIIMRENPEFVAWANTFLGTFGTNQQRMNQIVRELEAKDFLGPDSYLESQTKKDILSLIDELAALLENQQKAITDFDVRVQSLEKNIDDIDTVTMAQAAYITTIRGVLTQDTLESNFVSSYRQLAAGLAKARLHYEFMDETNTTSLDELEGDVWVTQDDLIRVITEDFFDGSTQIVIPSFPLVYTSWASLENTDRIVEAKDISDDDRSRLGLESSDEVIDVAPVLAIMAASAQKCLNQVSDETLEKSYIQVLGMQKGNVKQAYVAIISDPMINGFEVTPESLTSGIVHPWHTTSGFQDTLVSFTDFSCSPVEFS